LSGGAAAAPAERPGLALEIRGLTVSFALPEGLLRAVDEIDLEVRSGEVLGLVGESGSGKSVTLRSLVRLVRPPGQVAGRALWQGRDLIALPEAELLNVRGKEIAMIFQEPMSALNPVLTVHQQIDENLVAHTALGRAARRQRAIQLLDLVGIPAAAARLDDYPHQFSGGMRQRVMIAIALASEPRLLLADEPTTALDVTIQDQILKLLLQLRAELGMSVLLVTHDLGVVAQSCDRVAVMYAGRIMEVGPVVEVFRNPRHAYTLGLLGSIPSGGRARQPLRSIEGAPPALSELPPGCAFAPRCAFATEACRQRRPALVAVGPDHISACLHHDRVARGGAGG
jgi:oligopeptide/dipeptide ABC transporter ATP-binding protein